MLGYYFYRRHLVKSDPSVVQMFPTDDRGTSMMDDVTDANLTDDLFPRNHAGENDSVMLRGVTIVTNVGKIVCDIISFVIIVAQESILMFLIHFLMRLRCSW